VTDDDPTRHRVDLQSRYKENADFVFRRIADETILVPIRSNLADLDCIYSLNETASRVWELLDGQRTLGELVDIVVQEFDTTHSEARADLEELIRQLTAVGAIQEV
jgi:hypothetical protein